MNSNDHQRLFRLLEFKVLSPKRRKLVSAHLLEGVSLARGCSMLALNVGRESRREDITICLAAYNRAQDPDGQGQLFEEVRRLEECIYGRKTTPDPDFENQMFDLEPQSFLYRELGIRSLPAHPTPLTPEQKAGYEEYAKKYVSVERAATSWQCSCRPESTQPAGQYLCYFCGSDNPTTAAKRASDPYRTRAIGAI